MCSVSGCPPVNSPLPPEFIPGVVGSPQPTEGGWGHPGFSRVPVSMGTGGHPWALCPRRAERTHTFQSSCCRDEGVWGRDEGVQGRGPYSGRVWVGIKRSSHSHDDTMATLVLGARFPPHVNAWILLLKKGRVTMVFVGTLKMWSEKTKSGTCAQKHSSPFMPTG